MQKSMQLPMYSRENWRDLFSVLFSLPELHTWFSELAHYLFITSNGFYSRVFSSITVWKHQFFGAQPSIWFNSHIWRLSRVPWTERRSNKSILNEVNPEYSLEGLMLKLQYFGHLMQRGDSLEKTLMLGKIEGKRRGRQRMRRLDSIADSKDMSLSKLGDGEGQGSLVCCSP